MSARRTIRGFTILEALITVAIAASLIIGIVTQYGTNFRFFAQTDDTLASARAAQLLLAYLKEDVELADSPGGTTDPQVSPSTGTIYPKNYVHLIHDPDSAQVLLYVFSMGADGGPLPGGDPITTKAKTDPLTRLALTRTARVQDAMAWVDPASGGDQRQRHFVINVRNGAQINQVTYSYLTDLKEVQRKGPDGTVHIGTGAITGFSACPYLEFLVPQPKDKPLELLKCWVEVAIEVQAAQKADPIAKKPVKVHTKLVPRMLIASVRGLSAF